MSDSSTNFHAVPEKQAYSHRTFSNRFLSQTINNRPIKILSKINARHWKQMCLNNALWTYQGVILTRELTPWTFLEKIGCSDKRVGGQIVPSQSKIQGLPSQSCSTGNDPERSSHTPTSHQQQNRLQDLKTKCDWDREKTASVKQRWIRLSRSLCEDWVSSCSQQQRSHKQNRPPLPICPPESL